MPEVVLPACTCFVLRFHNGNGNDARTVESIEWARIPVFLLTRSLGGALVTCDCVFLRKYETWVITEVIRDDPTSQDSISGRPVFGLPDAGAMYFDSWSKHYPQYQSEQPPGWFRTVALGGYPPLVSVIRRAVKYLGGSALSTLVPARSWAGACAGSGQLPAAELNPAKRRAMRGACAGPRLWFGFR